MKILVVILAILLAICIVACAPGVANGTGKENTVTRVGPVETKPARSAALYGWTGQIICLM